MCWFSSVMSNNTLAHFVWRLNVCKFDNNFVTTDLSLLVMLSRHSSCMCLFSLIADHRAGDINLNFGDFLSLEVTYTDRKNLKHRIRLVQIHKNSTL